MISRVMKFIPLVKERLALCLAVSPTVTSAG